MEKFAFKSYSDLVQCIKQNIQSLSQSNYDLVVGIPRSGMIPAYLISAYLNADCIDFDGLLHNRTLQRGITRKTKGDLTNPQDAKKIILVDDSIYSGESLTQKLSLLPEFLKEKISTLAIYSSGPGHEIVDMVFEKLEGRKLFEWGIYHNTIISKTCFDLDGVICEDANEESNDDGAKYLDFIENAKPLFIPTGKPLAIVTNRLEKYREATELWLQKHSVEYGELVMLNLPDKESRLRIDAATVHKAKFYKSKAESILFIESSLNQSLSIAKHSGKPVYCVSSNTLIEPGMVDVLTKNIQGYKRYMFNRFKHYVKMKIPIINQIKNSN